MWRANGHSEEGARLLSPRAAVQRLKIFSTSFAPAQSISQERTQSRSIFSSASLTEYLLLLQKPTGSY